MDRTQPPEVNYKIHVATSDLKNAGTDANVFIQVFGKRHETPRITLSNSKSHKNKFEKGNVDYFEVRAVDVGDIKKIKIGHDNKGVGPGWHCKEVLIETEHGVKYRFPCEKWFAKDEGDKEIERTLYPEDALVEKKFVDRPRSGNLIKYEVFIKTSDIMNAGTDGIFDF